MRAPGKDPVVSEDDMIEMTAQALANQQAVGWFQGRMEFGPRALGARSIGGDPRSPTMQRNLNLKVRYRESFRPFAPSVLREDGADWFELESGKPLHANCCGRAQGPALRYDP
jgi:carbamoyltransferase